MYPVIIVLTVIVAILLIGIVLIQKSKGGGLSSQFGGAGSVMGVRQTNSFLEKGTWTLISVLVVLSIISSFLMPKASTSTDLRTKAAATTTAPAAAPAGQFDTPALPVEAAPAAEATEVPAE